MKNNTNSQSNNLLNRSSISDVSNHQRGKSKSVESIDIYLEGIENLKREINNLTNNFDKINHEQKIPIIVLETIPLGDLEILVENLREKMEDLVNFVSLEEKELTLQKESVQVIEAKLVRAKQSEKLSLQQELAETREAMKLLEKTLVGQRRNLKKQKEILNQHLKILNRRKGIFDLKSFDTISLDPILKPPPETDLSKKIQTKLNQTNLENLKKIETQKVEVQKPKLNFYQPIKLDSLKSKQQQQQQKQQWSKWTIGFLVVGLLIITGSMIYSLKWRTRPWEKASPSTIINEPTKKDAVAAIGYIEPKGEAIKLSAPGSIEGVKVEQLLVKRGDKVKKGQVIAIMDNRDRLQANLEQAQSQVNLAQAKLAQIKAGAKVGEVKAQEAEFQRTQAELVGQIASQEAKINELEVRLQGEQQSQKATIRRIKAELNYAQEECKRHQILFEEGAVSRQKLNQICLAEDTNTESLKEAEVYLVQTTSSLKAQIAEAKANLERIVTTLNQQVNAEKATLEAIAEVPLVDIQVAQAELEAAKTTVKKAEADLKLAYIRAPRDGQILQIYTWPGEVVNEEGIVDLGQTDQMYVRAEVYETDIANVKIGQKAIIKSDGIVDELEGKVEEIGLQIARRDILDTDPVADADARVVEVKISLSPESSKKVTELTNLQVNTIIDTSQNINASQNVDEKNSHP